MKNYTGLNFFDHDQNTSVYFLSRNQHFILPGECRRCIIISVTLYLDEIYSVSL